MGRARRRAKKRQIKKPERKFVIELRKYDPDEYIPLKQLVPDAPEVIQIDEIITRVYNDLGERIKRRVLRQFQQELREKRRDLTSDEVGRVIDKVAIFYEREIDIGETTVRVMPMMQLFARGGNDIQYIYQDPHYDHLSRDRKNEFITALLCEKLNATLFAVMPETDYVPTMVAVIETPKTDPRFYNKIHVYPTY